MASLDIIIVDYRAGDVLRACLHSLIEAPPREAVLARVVVVDNAPGPESITETDGGNLPVTVLTNRKNRGFAAACNQGAAGSIADYLLFLNPDTRITEGALDRAVMFLERSDQRQTGIVGVQLLDEAGRVARTCHHFPRPFHFLNKVLGLDRISLRRFPNGAMSDWDHLDTRAVDQVMGAFFLVRRTLFERLGRFDERFFVYFEEVDLSLRAREAGFQTVFLADAAVYHTGCGTTDQIRGQRLFFSLQSRILYGYKHFSRFSATAVLALTTVLEPVARAVPALARGSWAGIQEVAQGYGMLWHWLLRAPAALRQERPHGRTRGR